MPLYRRVTIDDSTALKLGFPTTASPGAMVVDAKGIVWRAADDSDGLSDLGFAWTALIPVATSLIGGIFGSKAASKQAEALKAQAAAQVEIEQLKLQQAQAQAISPQMLLLFGAGLILVMALK